MIKPRNAWRLVRGFIFPTRGNEMNVTAKASAGQRALAFGAHEIKTIQRDGQVWMSGGEVGRALEYADPDTAIKKLYSRNADEFTQSMTKVVKVMTAGGKQAIRFFNLRGAHLLAMFARTNKAKTFRVWALSIIDAEINKPASLLPKKYNYPVDSAKPSIRMVSSIMTPQMLLDERNPAPEMELMDRLSADGHDVSGVRLRILAMKEGLRYLESMRTEVSRWERLLGSVSESMAEAVRQRGKPVSFGRQLDPCNAIDRHVYADQFPVGA